MLSSPMEIGNWSDSNDAANFSIQEMDLAKERAIDDFMKTCQCHLN